MNREIKFELIWDNGKTRRVVTLDEINEMGDDFKSAAYVRQFTGLLDKNGKEICRGDIVIKYPSKSRGNRKVQSYDGVVFEIKYQKEWACFIADAGKLSWLFELAENEKWDGDNEKFLTSDCEVIGDIYENPNLLTNYETK